jgi:hypothetical protein
MFIPIIIPWQNKKKSMGTVYQIQVLLGNIHFLLVPIRGEGVGGGIITFRTELKYDRWRILDLTAIYLG